LFEASANSFTKMPRALTLGGAYNRGGASQKAVGLRKGECFSAAPCSGWRS